MPVTQTETPTDALSRLRIQRDEVPRRGRGRSRFRRVLTIAIILLVCVTAVGLFGQRQGWFDKSASLLALFDSLQSRPETRVVQVTVERGRSADALVVATGYLESRRQAKIGARAPGRIEVVHVEEGSRVSRNETLAVLEHADMDAALAAANATLDRTRAELAEQDVEIERTARELERAEQLKASNSINIAEYDTARFQYQASVARKASLTAAVALSEARVSEAEQLKENMFIRAPFDGTVISKDAEVGESILPGGMGEASGRGSVVTIADLEHLEVDCDVKEDYISRVQEGQFAEVAVDAVPDKRYRGQVRKIIPMGDRARATVKVKVEILDSDARLFPDMSSTVYFLPDDRAAAAADEGPRIFCPKQALTTQNGKVGVWVVDAENRIRFTPVETGDSRDDRTELTAGLVGGETIVAVALETLQGGDRIRPVQ